MHSLPDLIQQIFLPMSAVQDQASQLPVHILDDEYDVWAGLYAVPTESLRRAVSEVGNDVASVGKLLQARRGRSGEGAASALACLQQDAMQNPSPVELAVATTDSADTALAVVPPLLRLIKNRLAADVVFVSQFVDGQRVFRYVDVPVDAQVIQAGGADPLEASWCQKVVDGRLAQAIPDAALLQAQGVLPVLPFPIGTHLSTPILMSDGTVYGTLCCFSFAASQREVQHDLHLLRAAAQLLAERLQDVERRRAGPPVLLASQ